MIKDLYDGFAERVGKKLAERKRLSGNEPVEEALKREKDSEIDYLRDVEKMDERGIRRWLPGTNDPVTAGVHKPGGVLRACQL